MVVIYPLVVEEKLKLLVDLFGNINKMKLLNILKESYDLYKVDALLKTNLSVSKTEIINKVRAVPYIIIVRLREDPRLMAHSSSKSEYTLLSIKFLNFYKSPSDTLMKIHNIMKQGDEGFHKIPGLLDFRPLTQTLKKI